MSARSYDLNSTKKQSNIRVIGDLDKEVLLHGHSVVKIYGWNNKVTLDSCGYKTPTTKVTINRALEQITSGYAVIQKKGEWFLSTPDSQLTPFTDGMSINL